MSLKIQNEDQCGPSERPACASRHLSNAPEIGLRLQCAADVSVVIVRWLCRGLPAGLAALLSPMYLPLFRTAAAVSAVAASLAAAELSDQRMEVLFRPFLADHMTMSHDGRYVAYGDHSGTDLTVKIVDLDQPGSPKTVIVQEDRVILNSTERQRASLRFLRWAEGNRLVFAPSIYRLPQIMSSSSVHPDVRALGFSPPPPPYVAPIMAIDATGDNPVTLADSDQFNELGQEGVDGAPPDAVMRANRILGFAAGKRDTLLVALPNATDPVSGRAVPSGVFELNVRSGALLQVNEDSARGAKHYDRWGQARLLDEGTRGRRMERSLLYSETNSSRWRPLDTVSADADFSLTPANYYGERSVPLGIGYDRDVLLFASNVGRDTFGIYGLDLRTQQRASLTIEHPARDLVSLEASVDASRLVFDDGRQALVGIRAFGDPPLTIWLDPELAEAQRAFDVQFPRRSVEIVEWNDDRTRFLLRVTGGADPGRVYVFKRNEGVLTELSRRAPWLTAASLHDTRAVTFPGPDGTTLSGYLTRPRAPRVTPTPLVIVFAPGLPAEPHDEFDREVQVLADMGLTVLRLNQRGVNGRGRAQREVLRRGPDAAALADTRAAIDWVASILPIERKRVVTMGQGFAGYLALRVAQLDPALIRCVVAVEPEVEPARLVRPAADLDSQMTFSQEANRLLLETEDAPLHKRGVVSSGSPLYHPTFIIYRGYLANEMTQGVARLRGRQNRSDVPVETIEVRQDYFNAMPKARGKVYRELQDFLNLNLYEYEVKLGTAKVDA